MLKSKIQRTPCILKVWDVWKQMKFPVSSGDICALIGIEGFEIGDTVAIRKSGALPQSLSTNRPWVCYHAINDSPFFGKDGKVRDFTPHPRPFDERTWQEPGFFVRKEWEDGKWIVSGRGVLHLSVLIETMRREGYELQVGQPQVIFKKSTVSNANRLKNWQSTYRKNIPARLLIWLPAAKVKWWMENTGERINLRIWHAFTWYHRSSYQRTDCFCRWSLLWHNRFKEYQPYKGEIERRTNGSMIAMESGTAFAYAIDKLQDRGKFFIFPQDEVYAGPGSGRTCSWQWFGYQRYKIQKLTNMRASGSDDKVRLIPPVQFSFEEALNTSKKMNM